MNKEQILLWLKKTAIPMTVISERTGISTNTLYSWRNSKTNIRNTNMAKLVEQYGDQINKNDSDVFADTNYKDDLIKLQKEKIKSLEERISLLEAKRTTDSNDQDPAPPDKYHCYIEYKLYVSKDGVGRQVKHFEGFKMAEKWMGYNKQEWMNILEVDQVNSGIMSSALRVLHTKEELEEATQAEESMRLLYKNIANTTTTWSSSDKVKMFVHKNQDFVPLRLYDHIHWPTMTRKQYWVFINGEDVV